MSDYAFVAERAKKAFASVAKLENALARNPSDRASEMNLMSARRLAEKARQEMERLAELNQVEICQYRIVPATGEYGLAHVSSSLLEYQNLFSQIYDAFKNGKKDRAQIGSEAEAESTLDLAYTYSGSLGVALLARSRATFFGGSLDETIDMIYQVMSIGDVEGVKAIAGRLGRAVVKRVHDWSKANAEGGFATDIQWKRSDGKLMRQMVDSGRLAQIAAFIERTSDEKIAPYEFTGQLGALAMR